MQKQFILAFLAALSLATSASIAAEPVDKCAACKLLTKDEMTAIMGELKGEPTCDTGLHPGEVTCNFDNMKGSWLKVYLYNQGPDQWELQKNLMPNERTPLEKLGDEAFWTKAGTDKQVYIRKGGKILQVDSSGGLDFAKAAAEKAFARLK